MQTEKVQHLSTAVGNAIVKISKEIREKYFHGTNN